MEFIHKLLIAVAVIIVAGLGIFLIHANGNNSGLSYTSVLDLHCLGCTNIDPFFSLLSHYNISSAKTFYFGSNYGNSLISNYSIVNLPSVIINETQASANIFYSLIYLNIFNLDGNSLVLNTPFLAGLYKNTTFFDIIQNRTILSTDIYNQSNVYNLSGGSSLSKFINPSQFLLLSNSSNVSLNGKVEIDLVFGNSPFSALQTLILFDALSNFGTFSNYSGMKSSSIAFSSNQTIGPVYSYNLTDASYSSNYFYLNLTNISSPGIKSNIQLQKELFQFDQNSVSPAFGNVGNFLPFMDIGGRYISVSSMLNPVYFSNIPISNFYKTMAQNSTAGKIFNDSVAFVNAVLCSDISDRAPVCRSNIVKYETNSIYSAALQ